MKGGAWPAEPIRLIVSDIDGTLVTHAKVLTPRTRAAIAGLADRGIGFTVTTARPPVGLRSIIDLLGLKVPAAAVNGGAIVNADLTIVEEKLLAPDLARRSVAYLRAQGLDPWLFTDSAWYCRNPEGDHVDLETRTIAQDPTVVEDFEAAVYDRVLKITGACKDHAFLARCETTLQQDLGSAAIATCSQAYYLDVTSPLAHKGEAVVSPLPGYGSADRGHPDDRRRDKRYSHVAGFGLQRGHGQRQ